MLSDIKRIPVINFIIYTIVSCGTFPFLWLISNINSLNNVAKQGKITFINLVVLASLWSWASYFMGFVSNDGSDTDNLLLLTNLALNVAFLVFQFVMVTKPFVSGLDENLLNDYKIDLRPNMIWAFLFGYFYIVYSINKIDDLVARSNVLKQPTNHQPE